MDRKKEQTPVGFPSLRSSSGEPTQTEFMMGANDLR